MYIYPNTTLKILNNVPLNSDYDHTMYFDGKIAQTEYFLSKAKYTLTNQSYQRKERGWIQVNINQNNLWDCTYIMYQNTSYNNKWFYAFILSVDYVNNSVSRINFEIDVIQTWAFDYTIDKCFIEREHSATDYIFENTIEENLDLGNEYVIAKNYFYDLDPTLAVMTITGRANAQDPQLFDPVIAGKRGNYFCGLRYQTYDVKKTTSIDSDSLYALKHDLLDYIEHGFEDAVVSIRQYPRFMGLISTEDSVSDYTEVNISFSPILNNIDGYTPKNNKLYCYPYNFLTVSNTIGDSAIYKFEIWTLYNHIGEFKLCGTITGVPTTIMYPLGYKNTGFDYSDGLTNVIDIECAWVGDAYQVWLAQNSKNIAVDKKWAGIEIGAGLIGGLIGGVAGNKTLARTGSEVMSAGVGNLFSTIKNEIRAKNTLEATPRTAHGQINNSVLNLQGGLYGYRFEQKTIRAEYARVIDQYFSRFGYACHQTKVPNIRNQTFPRKYWAYTKTAGCELTGNIPSDDVVKIKSIYDNGITFWNMYQLQLNNKTIGDYGDFTNPVM